MSAPDVTQGFAGRVFNTGARWVAVNSAGIASSATTAGAGGGGDTFDAGGGGSLVNETDGGNGLDNIDYPKALSDKFKKWKERVANYSPWNDVFSVAQQESNLIIDVPFENRYWFTVYAIGFSWVEGTRLKRINPVQHPYYSWMNCSRAASQGVRFEGSKAFFSSEVGNTSNASGAGVAKYKLARFNLGFANYPWRFLPDSDVANDYDEASRNVFFEMQPTAQMLAAEGGAATLGYPRGPGAQSQYRAPFGTVVGQIKFVFHWKWVPWDYVLKGMIPANLASNNFTCNDATFFTDFPKGTLLFEPPHITTYVAPLRPFLNPVFYCDIDIPMTYFNPTNGLSNPTPGYDRLGHNLMPFRERPGLWYPATRPVSGSATYPDPSDTNMLFAYSDFRKIFQKPV